jgi:membrane protease YdiL (CAAX protease family)
LIQGIWFDWIFIAALTLLIPTSAARSYQQILPRLRANEPGIREAVYLSSMLSQWIFVAIISLWWWYQDRDFQTLMLGLPQMGFIQLAWLALIIAYGLLVVRYTLYIIADPERHKNWYQRLHNSPGIDVTPARQSQLRSWWLVSLTAGFCEEFIYRAFVLWLLGLYLSPLLALLVMALLFGIGHRYQGREGIWMTAALGLFMGIIYLHTDTLWIAALAHAVIDASHGWAAYRIYHNYVDEDMLEDEESFDDQFEA